MRKLLACFLVLISCRPTVAAFGRPCGREKKAAITRAIEQSLNIAAGTRNRLHGALNGIVVFPNREVTRLENMFQAYLLPISSSRWWYMWGVLDCK